MLQMHRRGILAYYDYPISTGPLEGTNNKIKTLQKQAYGFRDKDCFKLKIYALHESRYALVGWTCYIDNRYSQIEYILKGRRIKGSILHISLQAIAYLQSIIKYKEDFLL